DVKSALVLLTIGLAAAVPPSLASRDGAAAWQAAQAQRGATAPRPSQPAGLYTGPRTPDRKPDLNGIWQVLGTAHGNLEGHSASEGVPAGFSVVEGGTIPYQPAALARRNE